MSLLESRVIAYYWSILMTFSCVILAIYGHNSELAYHISVSHKQDISMSFAVVSEMIYVFDRSTHKCYVILQSKSLQQVHFILILCTTEVYQ